MTFKKGHKTNLGKKRPDVIIRNKSKNHPINTGRTRFKKGHKINLGKKKSKLETDKMSNMWKEKYKNGYQNPWKGKKRNEISGNKNPSWKGGITPLAMKIRNSVKYVNWRGLIFERDKWTCQTCRIRGIYLEAHHIISFSQILKENKIKTLVEAEKYKELWDLNNGVTLCRKCHKLTRRKNG